MNKRIKTLLSATLFTISFLTYGAFSQDVFAATIPYVASQKSLVMQMLHHVI